MAAAPAVEDRAGLEHLAVDGVCGDFQMRIARDGTWFYRGSPIGRIALVKLFATVLHRKADSMKQEPCRLLRDTKGAVKFPG